MGFPVDLKGEGPTSDGGNVCEQTCLWSPYVLLDYEFTENCGLNDFGDTVAHPFRKCSPGYCNPNSTELCSPCSSGATTPARMESHSRTQKQCRKVLDAWALGQGLPEVAVGCCGFHEQSLGQWGSLTQEGGGAQQNPQVQSLQWVDEVGAEVDPFKDLRDGWEACFTLKPLSILRSPSLPRKSVLRQLKKQGSISPWLRNRQPRIRSPSLALLHPQC